MTGWKEDILGPGFECMDLDLGEDAEGPLVATLVRSLPAPRGFWERHFGKARLLEDIDILYVHGWSDYFFQRTLARFFTDRGARFFALDLRKYGRSLRPGQTFGYIDDLEEYDEEIGLALDEMRGSAAPGESPRRTLLFGHSTGGLILSLWADRHPGVAAGVLLNSPWLELQIAEAGRQWIAPIVNLSVRLNPREAGPQLDFGFYSRAQAEVGPRADLDGVNTEWRPDRTHPVLSGWMRAILVGHARVASGLDIQAPVGMLLSKRYSFRTRWSESLTRVDTVLDVDAVARASLKLGAVVSIGRIDGALHDVFLSADEPRAEAYRRLEEWLVGWRAVDAAHASAASRGR
ncbi:alpha/beta hydrolase [Leucobacter sp. CSA2]|uniref:Alpha/beta hydrolase n=1 Tax=Leucobacter edaphi TaxID=2796472 RepID=A0A934UY31_9MICO|nr:alpha/beta hydrolase [Leucobacter edaphi]MBK0421998.1 alpha/beta hydrolase [Leucobacter edaphi]